MSLKDKDIKGYAEVAADLLNWQETALTLKADGYCQEFIEYVVNTTPEYVLDLQARCVELEEKLAVRVELPAGLAQKIKVPGYYEALNDLMDCVRSAGFKIQGDEQ